VFPPFRRALCGASILGASALALAGCGDGGTEVRTFPLTVRVQLPATYAQTAAAGAQVVLRNTERNTADTALADAAGAATFGRVVPGSYQLSASLALTAEQAFALAGQRTAVTLNAALPAQTLADGAAAVPVLTLGGARLGDLVIKEVSYTGSRTPSGGTYFSDQFVEVYNNSTDTLYLDSLHIADVYGVSGQINATDRPTPFNTDAQHVYLSSIWMVPGTGRQYPLAPGASAVIAQDGINHRGDPNGNPNSPVDLSAADFETFNQRDDGRDLDAPGVANLERRYFTGGFDWLLPVFGPGVVIFRTPNSDALERVAIPGATAGFAPRVKLPVGAVVDAFEALQNGNSATYKRVPAALDAGFVFASGTYTGQSARRKTAATVGSRRVLQDTNNSSDDFEVVATPTPRGFGGPALSRAAVAAAHRGAAGRVGTAPRTSVDVVTGAPLGAP